VNSVLFVFTFLVALIPCAMAEFCPFTLIDAIVPPSDFSGD